VGEDIKMKINNLDRMVYLQARAYGMSNFDLNSVIQLSKTSSQKSFAYNPTKENFMIYPILDIHLGQSGKVALLILPDEKCVLVGDKKEQRWGRNDIPMEIIKFLSKGYFVLSEESHYSRSNVKGWEVTAFLCEDKQWKAEKLIEELIKVYKSSYSSLDLSNDESPIFTLSTIKDKVREQSIKNLVNSLEIQLSAYKTWISLNQVKFDMPSVSTSRITFTSDGHIYAFHYPSNVNPSHLTPTEKVKEEVEDPHYWLNIVRDNWETTLNNGIDFFLKNKAWFEFSVDGKTLKIEIKTTYHNAYTIGLSKASSLTSLTRIYIDGIPTKFEAVIPALLSLKINSKEDLIQELKNIHDLSPSMANEIKNGLHGTIIDLENTVDVNVKINRKGKRYFLIVDNKEYLVNGGFQNIKKFQSCLEGSSKRCPRWDKIGVEHNKDAKLFIDLLVEALGEEKGIEFYQLIKIKDLEQKIKEKKEFGKDA
jgi:hypothetical protein